MFNVLKVALVYTGVYLVFCIAYLLLLVGIQIFWKPVIVFFAIVLAWLGYDYYTNRGTSASENFFVDFSQAFSNK